MKALKRQAVLELCSKAGLTTEELARTQILLLQVP
jgi:hypothetical protein